MRSCASLFTARRNQHVDNPSMTTTFAIDMCVDLSAYISNIIDVLIDVLIASINESRNLFADIFEFEHQWTASISGRSSRTFARPRNNLFIMLYIEALLRLSLSNKFYLRKLGYSQFS